MDVSITNRLPGSAESGRQVLAIDCDLRNLGNQRPPAGSGLAGILRGETEPQDAVVQTSMKGLELVEAGLADTEPAMLFIVPVRPSSPKRLPLLAAGFMMSAFLAGFVAALKDLMSRRIRFPDAPRQSR